jgi:hypothetical protein
MPTDPAELDNFKRKLRSLTVGYKDAGTIESNDLYYAIKDFAREAGMPNPFPEIRPDDTIPPPEPPPTEETDTRRKRW